MALIACRECQAQVSTKAQACPSCGAKVRHTPWTVKAIVGLLVIWVIGALVSPKRSAQAPYPQAPAPVSTSATSSAGIAPQRQPGKAVAALVKSYDEVEKVTWYRDKSSPGSSWRTGAYFYIGDKNEQPWLRMKIQYAADDWLFIRQATFVIDGDKAGLVTGAWKRDHGSTIFEWIDVEVGPEQLHLLRLLLVAKTVTVRFEGDRYIKDYRLSAADLKALKSVVAAYKELGGSTY